MVIHHPFSKPRESAARITGTASMPSLFRSPIERIVGKEISASFSVDPQPDMLLSTCIFSIYLWDYCIIFPNNFKDKSLPPVKKGCPRAYSAVSLKHPPKADSQAKTKRTNFGGHDTKLCMKYPLICRPIFNEISVTDQGYILSKGILIRYWYETVMMNFRSLSAICRILNGISNRVEYKKSA